MSPLLTHATIEYKNVTSHESHSAYNRALHASFVICRNIFIEFWAPNSLPCKFELNAMQYALLICKWNVTCSSQWRWHLHVAFPYWKFKEHHRHKKKHIYIFLFLFVFFTNAIALHISINMMHVCIMCAVQLTVHHVQTDVGKYYIEGAFIQCRRSPSHCIYNTSQYPKSCTKIEENVQTNGKKNGRRLYEQKCELNPHITPYRQRS